MPTVELWLGRLIFTWNRRNATRASVNARFQAEREKIADLVSQCGPDAATRRVLIQRVRGLEDSSRYWSVLMTLDHLRIIHTQMGRIIKSLAAGNVPPGKASTANVKPGVDVTPAVIPEYEQSCDQLLATVA